MAILSNIVEMMLKVSMGKQVGSSFLMLRPGCYMETPELVRLVLLLTYEVS